MKKRYIPLLALSSLGLLTALFSFNFVKNEYQEVEAYNTSSLPTTINLNDTSSSEIRGYYSSVNGLRGDNLLIALKTVLSTNQKYYSYDSGDTVWKMYEITDRDWEKSPASTITYGTYNADTNTITGYQYGSNSSKKDNPYVHALYINRDVENESRAWGNHNQDQWGINREHVWPKSLGFETEGKGGARGDPMHLMAGNGYSNNIHSNYFYGYVDRSKITTDCGAKYSNQKGNYLGTSKTMGSGLVFEPQDSDKGDIARAVFYMVARYNYLSGSDDTGISSDNPNLELIQNGVAPTSGYQSTTNLTGKMGVLSDLLEWNRIDPVDEYEIHRNNLLYTNFTNNRNPFIDFPEWAEIIWGENVGVAHPSTDPISNNSPLNINGEQDVLYLEKTMSLSATTSDNSPITWTVSDNTVVSLSSSTSTSGETITITPLKEGEVDITATATIDSTEYVQAFRLKVQIYVPITSITLDKQELSLKDNESVTLVATINPSNASNKNLKWSSSDESIASVDQDGKVTAKKAGSVTITVKSEEDNVSATCKINVVATLFGIELTTTNIIIMSAVALAIIVIIIIVLVVSKKARKKVSKAAKKYVKNSTKKKSSKKSK